MIHSNNLIIRPTPINDLAKFLKKAIQKGDTHVCLLFEDEGHSIKIETIKITKDESIA